MQPDEQFNEEFSRHCKKEERQLTLSNALRAFVAVLFTFAIWSGNRWVQAIDMQFEIVARKVDELTKQDERYANKITALEVQRSEDAKWRDRIEAKQDKIIELLTRRAGH